jgi:hypothetical protein
MLAARLPGIFRFTAYLSSPLFGESIALVSGGGGNSASGNRRIEFQIKLAF